MSRNRTPILFAVGILAAFAGALLARVVLKNDSAHPALVSGTLLRPAKQIPQFELIDHNGTSFSETALKGRWTLMFFGFTNCGDICPTTLALLASVSKSLSDLPEARRPRVVFVSVDANRDTPPVIKEYLKHFDPGFVGVTGTQSVLDAFTLSVGVPSAIRPLESGYAVDHSASILAFNPRGEFQALFSAPHTVAALEQDLRSLTGMRL